MMSLALNETFTERFWSKVRKTDDCWVWTGGNNGRYGVIGTGGRKGHQIYAHRASWYLAHGYLSPSLNVCHHCDNPPCVRPDHLFLGTDVDNMRDCKAKGRWNDGSRGSKGMTNGRCVLTDEQILDMRHRRTSGWTYADLADFFYVGPTQVARICRREQRA